MRKTIRRRIISQTKQVAILVDSAAQRDAYCEVCGEALAMISPLLAANFVKSAHAKSIV